MGTGWTLPRPVLLIVWLDCLTHQLQALYLPPGSSSCCFNPNMYLALTKRFLNTFVLTKFPN